MVGYMIRRRRATSAFKTTSRTKTRRKMPGRGGARAERRATDILQQQSDRSVGRGELDRSQLPVLLQRRPIHLALARALADTAGLDLPLPLLAGRVLLIILHLDVRAKPRRRAHDEVALERRVHLGAEHSVGRRAFDAQERVDGRGNGPEVERAVSGVGVHVERAACPVVSGALQRYIGCGRATGKKASDCGYVAHDSLSGLTCCLSLESGC